MLQVNIVIFSLHINLILIITMLRSIGREILHILTEIGIDITTPHNLFYLEIPKKEINLEIKHPEPHKYSLREDFLPLQESRNDHKELSMPINSAF